MKRLTILLAVALTLGSGAGHVLAEDKCPLPIMVTVNNDGGLLTEANTEQLTNKIRQTVAVNGYGGSELAPLYLSVKVSETDKQVVSGNRPIVASFFDVYLTVGNLLGGGEDFGSTSISINGSGRNESQALQKAIAQINPSNQSLQKFLRQTNDKVFDYYRAHIPSIVSQAQIMANRGEYTKSLYLLATVPPCCGDYDVVGEAMLSVWQQYLDQDCSMKLAQAKAVWLASQTEEAAVEAAAVLAAIDPKSGCVGGVAELLSEIGDKIGEIRLRAITHEEEDRLLHRHTVEADIELEKARIEAIREIAIAYDRSVLIPLLQNAVTTQPQQQPPTIIIK